MSNFMYFNRVDLRKAFVSKNRVRIINIVHNRRIREKFTAITDRYGAKCDVHFGVKS